MSGFGMGEADSPRIGVTHAGVLGQGGLLPEKPTLQQDSCEEGVALDTKSWLAA